MSAPAVTVSSDYLEYLRSRYKLAFAEAYLALAKRHGTQGHVMYYICAETECKLFTVPLLWAAIEFDTATYLLHLFSTLSRPARRVETVIDGDTYRVAHFADTPGGIGGEGTLVIAVRESKNIMEMLVHYVGGKNGGEEGNGSYHT